MNPPTPTLLSSASRCWLVLLAAALLAPAAAAQEGNRLRDQAAREGTHVFRRILHEEGLGPLENFAELLGDPADSLLVLFGDLRRLEQPGRRWLIDFVARGGSVLLATDRGIPDENQELRAQVLELTGVIPQEAEVLCRNLDKCYRGNEGLPWLEPDARAQGPAILMARFGQDSLRVATNNPAFLFVPEGRSLPQGIFPVAMLPTDCWAALVGSPHPTFRIPLEGRNCLFGVAGERGGKVLVLADHSIFINEMMLPSDNNNVEFAYNCVRWLADRPGGVGQKRRVLFVEDGNVNTLLNVPLRELSEVPEELLRRLLANLDRGVAELEDRDTFNRMLLEYLQNRNIGPGDVLRVLFLLASLGLVVFGFVRLTGRARYRGEPGLPPLEQAVARQLPTGTVLAQRQRAVLREGNLWEPAHALAREVFGAAAPSPKPPRFVVRGGWWERWRWQRRAARLWRLAYGRPVPVPPSRWPGLLRDLDDLRRALADGTVTVATGGEW
jgi:hypothetical protein